MSQKRSGLEEEGGESGRKNDSRTKAAARSERECADLDTKMCCLSFASPNENHEW